VKAAKPKPDYPSLQKATPAVFFASERRERWGN
jgi:hypothetical protein